LPHWAQNLSTVAVAGLSWTLAYIALGAVRYQRLGREALLCVSGYLAVVAVARCLSTQGWISSEAGRFVSGMAAFAALVVLAQLAWLKATDRHLRKKETA
jgi:hypothetical protein